MKNKLLIAYKNGTSDEFSEEQLDCSTRTIKGHAAALLDAMSNTVCVGLYRIDNYNAINIHDIISVRVL